MDKFGENTRPLGANTNPMAGVVKPNVAQTKTPIKKAAMAPVTPAAPATPSASPAVSATPAGPFSANMAPEVVATPNGQPPSLTNVAANPQATGQATQQEVAGLSLEQWRNVQRMLGMAPSV